MRETKVQALQGDIPQIFGSGEMAALIRSRNWIDTTLGPIESWPPALVLNLNTLLAAEQPMVLVWGSGLTHFYNDGFRRLLGPDKHPACLGIAASVCWHEIWDRMQPRIDAVLQHSESSWFEDQPFPVAGEDNLHEAYWTYGYSPVRDLHGSVCGVLIVCEETTATVQAERKLQSVLETTTDAVLGIDRNWRIDYLNQHAIETFALAGDRRGLNLRTAFPSLLYEGSPYMEHCRQAMDHGIAADFEAYYPEPLNLWMRVLVRPVPDGILFFFRDITNKKREYSALMQSEKLAAVGRIASSIAHEINNPLESLTNLIYLLQHIDDPEQHATFLAQAQNELNRIARITTQTLRFHRQSAKPQPVHLREVLDNVLALMQGRLRSTSVSIETEYRTEQTIFGFEADLRQVFVNLVANALDAANSNGRIAIRIEESAELPEEAASVRVIIADNGHGMDSTTRHRIFEPFFTTRPLSGTGLGLWVSMEILNHHGAHVRVRSSQSPAHHGTVFSVNFPLTPPASLTPTM